MPEKKIFNKNFIEIKGAREHNLKNINTNIPRDKFVVITGLSGSGKSSLAFDTLYAEGQRRYVESLSSYARQFLGKISKPDVDNISGIPPAIAIEQRVNTHNPRSTVGTSTEIYEYIKLLFARIGITYSPISGNIVKKHSTADVINFISSQKQGTKAYLIIPSMQKKNITPDKYLSILLQQGYSRVLINNKVEKIENIIENKNLSFENFRLVIDRFEISYDNIFINRLADSVETAFFEGNGTCIIKFDENFKARLKVLIDGLDSWDKLIEHEEKILEEAEKDENEEDKKNEENEENEEKIDN